MVSNQPGPFNWRTVAPPRLPTPMAGVAQFEVVDKVLRLTALVTVKGQLLRNTWPVLALRLDFEFWFNSTSWIGRRARPSFHRKGGAVGLYFRLDTFKHSAAVSEMGAAHVVVINRIIECIYRGLRVLVYQAFPS